MSASLLKIIVLDGATLNPGDNAWDPVAAHGELTVYDRTPPELIVERAQGAHIILTNKTPLSAETIGLLQNLRFIAELATGYNNIDVAAAGLRGIPVANVPEYSTASVAQHTLALILALANGICLHNGAVQRGEWVDSADFSFCRGPLVELAGKRLGIVGLGVIGRSVARIAHIFGMEILAYNPHTRLAPEGVPVTWTGIEELFSSADIVTLHCPLTSENAGFVDKRLLSLMKPSAFLINTARGALVDEAALAGALNGGMIAGAGLDVVAVEPMLSGNPLRAAKNCIITPHIAWASLAARRRLMAVTADNVAAFLKGSPINVINSHLLQKG